MDHSLMIDLSAIVMADGAVLNINKTFPANAFSEFDSSIDFASDIAVTGTISNLANILFLNATISFSANLLCDRCLTPFTKEFHIKVEERLAKPDSSEEEGDYIEYTNDKLLLSETIYQYIFLEVSEKQLCSDDCKGLCTRCGADLNTQPCSCDTREIDPRLLKLKDFLK